MLKILRVYFLLWHAIL